MGVWYCWKRCVLLQFIMMYKNRILTCNRNILDPAFYGLCLIFPHLILRNPICRAISNPLYTSSSFVGLRNNNILQLSFFYLYKLGFSRISGNAGLFKPGIRHQDLDPAQPWYIPIEQFDMRSNKNVIFYNWMEYIFRLTF